MLGWLTLGNSWQRNGMCLLSPSWRVGHSSMNLALGNHSRDHFFLARPLRCGDHLPSTHAMLTLEFLLFPTVPHVSCQCPHPTSQHPDTDSSPIYNSSFRLILEPQAHMSSCLPASPAWCLHSISDAMCQVPAQSGCQLIQDLPQLSQ